MFENERVLERKRRMELMKELQLLNQSSPDTWKKEYKESTEALDEIEKRVASFFKGGKINYNGFEYYLFELGDMSKKNRHIKGKNMEVFDSETGKKMTGNKFTVTNIYVKHAEQVFARIHHQVKNRAGVSKEFGHYQRVVRSGMAALENKIGTGERKRILQLYPSLLYKNKIDIEQVALLWGMKRAGAVRQMQHLTSEENGSIVLESKVGRKKVYSFNPKYTFSGSGGKKKDYDVKVYVDFLNQVIFNVQQIETDLAAELGAKDFLHSALSTLHAIIPYFHYQTCYAVLNPTESITIGTESVWDAKMRELETDEESKLDYMNITQLARIVSKKETSLNYIKRDLYILEKAEAVIFTGNTILINPKLMFAMNDEFNTENDPYIKSVLMKFKDEKDARTKQKRTDKKRRQQLVKRKVGTKRKEEQ